MPKKIGILTFHRYYNYGTALQSYALQHFISQNYNCEVEIIDYLAKNEYVGKKLLLTRIKRLGAYITSFSKYYSLYKNSQNQVQKVQKFNGFFEHQMVLSAQKTDTVDDLTDICKNYDAVMIGSDQTWNPFVSTRGVFLLEYLDGKKVKKLAYAPSIGISKIPEEYVERYKNALSDFEMLSCRERCGAESLSDLLKKNVECVLDPTLLLKPSDWEQIATPVDVQEPYLLTYFLGDNKAHRKAVEKIAAEKNLKIVTLPVSYIEINNKKINKQYVGPCEFISLFKNASFICTDSFHGTMFSINFGKDFMSFPKRNDVDINSDNNRLYDALTVFGLENRLGINGRTVTELIDYEKVNAKLNELRESSKKYLDDAINSI